MGERAHVVYRIKNSNENIENDYVIGYSHWGGRDDYLEKYIKSGSLDARGNTHNFIAGFKHAVRNENPDLEHTQTNSRSRTPYVEPPYKVVETFEEALEDTELFSSIVIVDVHLPESETPVEDIGESYVTVNQYYSFIISDGSLYADEDNDNKQIIFDGNRERVSDCGASTSTIKESIKQNNRTVEEIQQINGQRMAREIQNAMFCSIADFSPVKYDSDETADKPLTISEAKEQYVNDEISIEEYEMIIEEMLADSTDIPTPTQPRELVKITA